MTAPVALSAGEIRALLTELGRRLDEAGVEATVYVVGGAAIALELDRRRVTVDVDAVFHPATTVRAQVVAMARERDLPPNWLDDAVRPFLPGDPDDDIGSVKLDLPGISVAVASPRHLLAMKMAAYRPGLDQRDLEILFRVLEVVTPEQAADIATAVYGEHSAVLPGRDELVLSARAVFDRLGRGPSA